MKAIELKSKTDEKGHLKIDYNLNTSNNEVRVIILFDETESDEEKLWSESIAKNPSFNFLAEESEDIYSLDDGEPFNLKK